MERAGTSGRNQIVSAELIFPHPVAPYRLQSALGTDGSASFANGDFGRELRVAHRKAGFSATADVQMSPLARAIQRFELGIF